MDSDEVVAVVTADPSDTGKHQAMDSDEVTAEYSVAGNHQAPGVIAALVRSLYPRLIITLGVTFNNPQKLLRPEGPSLERLNSMIKRARLCPKTNAVMSLRQIARTRGVPSALFLASVPGAANQPIESTYSHLSNALPQVLHLPPWVQRSL